MEFIEAKTILQKQGYGEEWFGIDYNMNLYKGCCHKCIYCDRIFKEECEKYGLFYKMSDIVKAYKKAIKQEEQLTFI